MKKGFKNLFKKNKDGTVSDKSQKNEKTSVPQEGYTTMESNSLYNLPANELVEIIFKFDLEVKSLNKDLQSTKESLTSTKNELAKVQEESVLYKKHNETLQSEYSEMLKNLNEAKEQIDSKDSQIDLIQNCLASKDQLLTACKEKMQPKKWTSYLNNDIKDKTSKRPLLFEMQLLS